MATYTQEPEDVQMEDSFAGGVESSSKSSKKPIISVVIDESHPFDLDAYISNYDRDRSSIKRLIFIANACPQLAPQALFKAVEYAKEGRDTNLYQSVLAMYNSVSGPQNASLSLDQDWLDRTVAKNQQDKEKLEVELKMYTGNMIKESVRMGHNDLGHFHRKVGDHATALRHYTKSREFCTTNPHVVEMCLNILELLLEEHNFAHISTYVFKAESTLESSASADKKKGQPNPEKDKIQAKLNLAIALSQIGQGYYENAAWAFMKVGKNLEGWDRKVASPSDIAIYGTLCALATFERRQIRTKLLENEDFSYYLEQEPYMREIIEAYLASKFRVVLQLLERYSSRHLLDNLLSPHVKALVSFIKDRALVLYFGPFASIRLESLADAFGLTLEDTEKSVVSLIQSGSIKGRVDSHNKILKAKDLDHRTELYIRALKTGQDIAASNRKLLYRLRLQEADVIVRAPKNLHMEGVAGYGHAL
ncbi:hypothetical protein CPB86DRAFT_774856 [Serendipita vermifera]|nr:hypothetical protein CPB86DRAFT_774856 [Serendipita vermifera]